MTLVQILLVLVILAIWAWLITSWRLRNWRAVTVAVIGTIAILAGGMLPAPARALAQGCAFLVTLWIFVIRPEMVGVMAPEEYDYVDAHVKILRRIGSRKHSKRRPDPDDSLHAFESDVHAMEALRAPPAWSGLHSDTVRELERRLILMKSRTLRSPEDVKPLDDRWQEVGQLFRDTLKERAGFWTGWPHPFRQPRA